MKRKRYIFKSEKNRESFQRWTDNRIQKLTAASAILFALSSAALGYSLALVSDDKTPIANLSTWPFALLITFFLISFVSGILVGFSQYRSFQQTCQIIVLRDKADDVKALEELREKNDATDDWTFLLFRIEMCFFLCGSFSFLIFIFEANSGRIHVILSHLL